MRGQRDCTCVYRFDCAFFPDCLQSSRRGYRHRQFGMGAPAMKAVTSSRIWETDRKWTAWMAAAQAGDKATYEKLLHECIPFIERVALRQGVRSSFVDDIVQETLLTIHLMRDT